MATTRNSKVGPATRPVAVPDDLDDPSWEKASGLVTLPPHICWSGRCDYDLTDHQDRISVYEQVMTEGTDSDIRRYITLEDLIEIWDELVLSPHVRARWEAWLKERDLIPA